MSPSSTAPVDKILEYTGTVATTLQDVASEIPFVSRVCGLALTILPIVQNTRFQRERCLRIFEDIHHILCILIRLFSQSVDIESVEMISLIAQFAVTLQKMESCLRVQQEMGTLRRLFKQSELILQLDICEKESKTALESFKIQQGVLLTSAVLELNANSEKRQQELLELIAAENGSLDSISSIGRNSLNTSSGSFSLLPASPKIFHGRDSELEDVVNSLLASPARVAILGPGGMGKTTLAVAALHSPRIMARYPIRHFIPCDSAYTKESLVATVASHLGLKAAHGTMRHVIHHLSTSPPCLVILDNFEAPWEPVEGRAKVEEFLSLLTDIPQMALLITMRGAERPSKVQWTRPFLRPLMPLPQDAAHQTIIEIVEDIPSDQEISKLLELTDNIPLAVQLVATVADSEGCQATLERWEHEKTSLLSAGCDRRSNLEASIMLSLSSPRMSSMPHAVDLLSLMSLLSDGISDLDLAQSKPSIPEILTSYIDHAGRLKVLNPIRDYFHKTRPPASSLVRPIRKHLVELLQIRKTFMLSRSQSVGNLTPRLVSNLGNLHNVLLHGLDSDDTDLRETVQGILLLSRLNNIMTRGPTPLMLRLPEILARMGDHGLHGWFIIEAFESEIFAAIPSAEKSLDEAIEHFHAIQDVETHLYLAVGEYYFDRTGDMKKARNLFNKALALASQCQSDLMHIQGLIALTTIEWSSGNYSEGLRLAREIHRLSVTAGYLWGEIDGIRWQAMCYNGLGHFKDSIELSNSAMAIVISAGLQGGQAEMVVMNTKALAYQLKSEYAEARRLHEAILDKTSATLSPAVYAATLNNITNIDIITGADSAVVSQRLDAATSMYEDLQYPRGIMFCDFFRAELMLREGDLTSAHHEYIRLVGNPKDSNSDITSFCLVKLADPNNSMEGYAHWAVVFLAHTMVSETCNILEINQALRCLGDVFASQGDDDVALSLLTVALEAFTQMDVHESRAECMRTIGDVHLRRGELSNASALWKDSRNLFERSSHSKAVAEIDARLAELVKNHEESLQQLKHLAPPHAMPVESLYSTQPKKENPQIKTVSI
ncbi:NB-ARC domain-containing protein [Mycena sanguinolenta]|uniref:NB-ARC domain-containing protein n=1 Tax=Mycena sanguinolenta TaxID=230812 RepID=A0A8H6ZBA0_9AGAR|nr:NB-ARC domain-containing protein [Mycena sanguinolenta]